MHEVLVNCLFKLVEQKGVVRLINCTNRTIAVVLDVKQQTKSKQFYCQIILLRTFIMDYKVTGCSPQSKTLHKYDFVAAMYAVHYL